MNSEWLTQFSQDSHTSTQQVLCDSGIQLASSGALHNVQTAPVDTAAAEGWDSQTNLVSQNSDGTCGGNLFLSKPHRGQVRRNTKNKHCGYWAHKLAKEGDREHTGACAADFYPSANAVEGWPDEDNIPDAPVVQKPQDGQDQGDVSEQVDHGQPVDGQRVNVVEAHEYVANDAVLKPHEGITGWDGAEEEQHEPATVIEFGLRLWEQLRVVTVKSLGI